MSNLYLLPGILASSTPIGGGVDPEPPVGDEHRYWMIATGFVADSSHDATLGEVELRETIGGSDLTTGLAANAVASSRFTSVRNADKVFDDLNSTRWQATTPFVEWVKIDLESPYNVAEIAVTSPDTEFDETPFGLILAHSDDDIEYTPYAYIETTNDWTSVETRVFSTPSQYAGEPDLTAGDAHRYYRLKTVQNNQQYQAIGLFDLLDGLGQSLLPTGGSGSSDSELVGNREAVDGFNSDLDEYWSSELDAKSVTLQWDFGAGNEQAVFQYAISGSTVSARGERVPRGFMFQASNDGTNWKTLDWKFNQPEWADGEKRTYAIAEDESLKPVTLVSAVSTNAFLAYDDDRTEVSTVSAVAFMESI